MHEIKEKEILEKGDRISRAMKEIDAMINNKKEDLKRYGYGGTGEIDLKQEISFLESIKNKLLN